MFYKDGVVATTINWIAPSEYVDGSAYGSSDHAGYELGVVRVDGQPPVGHISVPAAYEITSWPLGELNLGYGETRIALRTVARNGLTSMWSDSIVIESRDEREPNAPVNFSAA